MDKPPKCKHNTRRRKQIFELQILYWLLKYYTKSTSDKRKLDKVDLIKIKNLGASKDIIKKVKIQHTE